MRARPALNEGQRNPGTRLVNAPIVQRLMHRTAEMANGCWEWQGTRNPNGYGHIRRDGGGSLVAVHRASYEHFVGPIPSGLELDHLCRNRACLNPAHLEPVTRFENLRRAQVARDQQTHCKRGHAYTDENTLVRRDGKRECRACRRSYQEQYRRRGA